MKKVFYSLLFIIASYAIQAQDNCWMVVMPEATVDTSYHFNEAIYSYTMSPAIIDTFYVAGECVFNGFTFILSQGWEDVLTQFWVEHDLDNVLDGYIPEQSGSELIWMIIEISNYKTQNHPTDQMCEYTIDPICEGPKEVIKLVQAPVLIPTLVQPATVDTIISVEVHGDATFEKVLCPN